MTANNQKSLFDFPCEFPIKIMGEAPAELEKFVRETLLAHVKNPEMMKIKVRNSRDNRYQSITVIFEAHTLEQLHAIYQALRAHPAVQMVL